MSDQQAMLYAIGIIIIGFGAMFWNYGIFAVTTVRWSHKPIVDKVTKRMKAPKLAAKEAILCYIPGVQLVMVCKALYKKTTIMLPIQIIAWAGVVLNILHKYLFPINWQVMFIFNIIMWLCTLTIYLSYSVITVKCAYMYGFSWFSMLLCFVFPFLWCWWLHNNVPTKMRQLYKEDTFSEHHGDTIIKQRANQR